MRSHPFSVLISTYHKENPTYLKEALHSIWDEQDLKPDEIVLVEDGILSDELYRVIEEFKNRLDDKLEIVKLEKNSGLGVALNEGLKRCSYRVVARMDGDDIALPNRFKEQILFLENHQDISILGSWIDEYDEDLTSLLYQRKTPTSHTNILKYSKLSNPFNHMSVIFDKEAVLDAGGYESMEGREDYYLWIRMLYNDYKGANLPKSLLKVRSGKGMIERRSGISYLKEELRFARKVYDLGYFTLFDMIRAMFLRGIPRVLPKEMLHAVYRYVRRNMDYNR